MIDLTRLHASGFYNLSHDLQRACEDFLNGAVEELAAHNDDPERGDVGWRRQSKRTHLTHGAIHIGRAQEADRYGDIGVDDDGLAHWKHAAARLVLAVAREKFK